MSPGGIRVTELGNGTSGKNRTLQMEGVPQKGGGAYGDKTPKGEGGIRVTASRSAAGTRNHGRR